MKIKLVVPLVIVVIILIVSIFWLNFSPSFSDLPVYRSFDGTRNVGVGYSFVLSTIKYPNSQLYFLANLKDVYSKNGKAYADFIIYPPPHAIKQTFLLFDGTNQMVFGLNRQGSNGMLTDNNVIRERLQRTDEVVSRLKKYKGKTFIVNLDFKDPELLGTPYLKYLACNALFRENYNKSVSTPQCEPLTYDVSIYDH